MQWALCMLTYSIKVEVLVKDNVPNKYKQQCRKKTGRNSCVLGAHQAALLILRVHEIPIEAAIHHRIPPRALCLSLHGLLHVSSPSAWYVATNSGQIPHDAVHSYFMKPGFFLHSLDSTRDLHLLLQSAHVSPPSLLLP
mmetsp:Transcript_38212/g.81548  ORF Transcript_38212/g.81548 Transcript_38212/m.81548 type:complete len:139 (-) Transcript_38212:794-1210(-)